MSAPKPRPAATRKKLTKAEVKGNPLLGGTTSVTEDAPKEQAPVAPAVERRAPVDPARPAVIPPRNARTGVQLPVEDPNDPNGEPLKNLATRLPVALIRRVRVLSALHDVKQRTIYTGALDAWIQRARQEIEDNGFLRQEFLGDLSELDNVPLRNVSAPVRASLRKETKMLSAEYDLHLQVIYYAALRDFVEGMEQAPEEE